MKNLIFIILVLCIIFTIGYSDFSLNYKKHKIELNEIIKENNELKENIYDLKKQNEKYKYVNYILNSSNNHKALIIICMSDKISKLEKEINIINSKTQYKIPEIHEVKKYTVTAYSSKESSNYTSTGNHPRQGIVAASRDIIKQWGYGSKIYIFGVGEFTIDDTTHISKNNHIDIFMFNHSDATEFGIKKKYVGLLIKK